MTIDVKKTEPSVGTQSGMSKLPNVNFFDWLEGTKQEFKKINWTTKDELIVYTKIVAAAIFAVGIGIYVMDLVIQGTLSGIGALIRAVIG
jgi:preprotein translocase subunit SecE